MNGLADLPFAIVLELSPEGRLHVHGLMVPMGKAYLAISKTLQKASGRHLEQCVASQLTSKPFYCRPN